MIEKKSKITKEPRRQERFKIRMPVERLVYACLESLYFKKDIKQIKISVRKDGNQNLSFTYHGKGKIKAKFNKDVVTIFLSGRETEVKSWKTFFEDFATVKNFSLRKYLAYLQKNNSNP